MTTFDATDLATRLTRLERENRRLKRAGAILLLVGAAGLALGFRAEDKPKPKDLEASRIILKDVDGNVRGFLAASKDGVGLAFTEEDGDVRSALSLTKNGGAIRFMNDAGDPITGVGVQADGVSLAVKGAASRVSTNINALITSSGTALRADPFFDGKKK